MSALGVVLDACALIPMALCDTLLRAASAGMYRLYWTEDILEEVRRNLVENGLTSEQGAQDRVSIMRQAFPEASVTGYHRIVDSMTNDPKDRHVLAAAVTASAQLIVTQNLGDFPATALAPYNLEAQSPDEFLSDLHDLSPGTMARIVQDQARALQRPPLTVDELLDGLADQVPSFVEKVRAHQED
jgi:predicted nucleic acid-binding protein